jgi:ferrochelatase
MRLENILALTHGELLNNPFVKIFNNIVLDIKTLKRGDFFIAFDKELIPEAIECGAYGIMLDGETQISDDEIAWVKVQDCETALSRLMRFRLLDKGVSVYECNEIILKLALQVITEVNFITITGDIQTNYKRLWNIQERANILFCPTLSDKNIFTNIKQIKSTTVEPITIMEQTLFETSFIYDNTFYERQLISPFFIPYLEQLLHLYKSLKINFRLRKFTPIDHFQAVFTNKHFEIKEFGTSDKVLIFEPNSSLIDSEISFLKKSAAWANIIYIIPHAIKDIEDDRVFVYENSRKIIEILEQNSFHFALIAGVDKSILNKTRTNIQSTLNF